MRTVDRLLPCRFRVIELLEERLDSSCSPALTTAVAEREVEADRGDGEGVWPRKADASVDAGIARAIAGEAGVEREGGREFKSGAIGALFYRTGIS